MWDLKKGLWDRSENRTTGVKRRSQVRVILGGMKSDMESGELASTQENEKGKNEFI